MLEIAGGIIIAVLVLAYLDVILAFGLLALLAIGAFVFLFWLYEVAPAIATILGFIVLGAIAYFFDALNSDVENPSKPPPNQKKYWVVQVSGADVDIEEDVNGTNDQKETTQAEPKSTAVWRDLGVHHETLTDAMTFARRRYEYCQQRGSKTLFRVACSDGALHRVGNTPIYRTYFR